MTPRTEWACQLVAFIISAMLAPTGATQQFDDLAFNKLGGDIAASAGVAGSLLDASRAAANIQDEAARGASRMRVLLRT